MGNVYGAGIYDGGKLNKMDCVDGSIIKGIREPIPLCFPSNKRPRIRNF